MADYPEFDLPVELADEEFREGEEMEVLAKIRKKKDGKACFIEVEGISLGDDDDEEVEEVEEEEIPEDVPFDQAVMRRANRYNGI